ncbi:MEDS domain-containing protein [Pontibacter sp. JH31]|uniref:MEDS domain-containing protein n=1 Tax=Pontibacter aquaedesilientis TaxID=2766980 RepID=A0ABR7XBT7_9BACT|nr:MEDS domain-containing protein [Pontibacter aquaedesilientis]MBD1395752.1 MEDS domain-containing protein [Pontibacter aquaedesilientis]
MDKHEDWQECNSETFWCEVGSCSHVVQLYENEEALLSMLEDFVVGGIMAEESVILIATSEHLHALEERLHNYGLHVSALKAATRYIPLDAQETLSKFMLDDRPDFNRFSAVITEQLDRVQATGRKLRAFGEMVAILWEQQNKSGTILLEQYWNELLENTAFPLFCAYPRNTFQADGNSELSAICHAHSKLIKHSEVSKFDLSYQDVT